MCTKSAGSERSASHSRLTPVGAEGVILGGSASVRRLLLTHDVARGLLQSEGTGTVDGRVTLAPSVSVTSDESSGTADNSDNVIRHVSCRLQVGTREIVRRT